MRNNLVISAAAAALLSFPVSALAQSSVAATTDLNVRGGPGPQYPIVGMIGAGEATTLNGCLENSKWCAVATTGGEGWVYSDYLTGDFGGTRTVLTQRPQNSRAARHRLAVRTTVSLNPMTSGGIWIQVEPDCSAFSESASLTSDDQFAPTKAISSDVSFSVTPVS